MLSIFGLFAISVAFAGELFEAETETAEAFEYINSEGCFEYKIHLGGVDCLKLRKLPIDLFFCSSGTNNSKYLQLGWKLPLLEANIVPLSEKALRVQLPWNLTLILAREDQRPDRLFDESGQWSGKIEGPTTTIVHTGGTKLEFDRGRIIQLRLTDGMSFTWLRKSDETAIVDQDGETVAVFYVRSTNPHILEGTLKGEASFSVLESSSQLTQILFSDDRAIKLIRRAGLYQINGDSAGLIRPESFPERCRPESTLAYENLTIQTATETRAFTWEKPSGHIVLDSGAMGDWFYRVAKSSQTRPFLQTARNDRLYDIFSITRENEKGDSESLKTDLVRGMREIKKTDNTVIKTYFSTEPGPVYGKVRKIVHVDRKGEGHLSYSANFSKRGNILSSYDAGVGRTRYTYDDQSRLVAITDSSGQLLSRTYQSDVLIFEQRRLATDVLLELDFTVPEMVTATIVSHGEKQSQHRVNREKLDRLLDQIL